MTSGNPRGALCPAKLRRTWVGQRAIGCAPGGLMHEAPGGSPGDLFSPMAGFEGLKAMSLIQHELELTFPAAKVPRPVLCDMFRKHDGLVFNVARANVSQHRGHFHFTMQGEAAVVKSAEEYLRAEGIEVSVLRSGPFQGALPGRPQRLGSNPGEPRSARKLWLTYSEALDGRPIIWEMACRFDVSFDIRQSSVGKGVSIMAILLEGPASHVEGAMSFLQDLGIEVEPIEKSLVEG